MARSLALAYLPALLAAGLALAWPAPVWAGPKAAPSACAAAPRGAVPADRLAKLARGFNLTGWLDRPIAQRPDAAALKDLRRRGFTHVRLPIRLEGISPGFDPPAAIASHRGELTRAVDELLGLGFAVSLDMHPGADFAALADKDPQLAFARLEAAWRDLAALFGRTAPDRLFFELLNEPKAVPGWNAELLVLAGLVRRAAPAHTLIVGPTGDQRIEALEAMTPLPDRNVVYAIHVYDPMGFTHQGLDWGKPGEPAAFFRGVPFPSRPDDARLVALEAALAKEKHPEAVSALKEQFAEPFGPPQIDAIVGRAGAWAKSHDAPVIVNEFGVLRWKAEPADRIRWLEAVRKAAEQNCIGWAHWDYADGFGFMTRVEGRDVPDIPVLDALVGPAK